MVKLTTFAEAEAALAKYIPLVKEVTGRDMTLERVRPLMQALGSPHKKLKIVHVAGTSGKTSTSYFISALLTAAGAKTGLTVSPHIDKVTERLQINLKSISDSEFAAKLSEAEGIIKVSQLKPTYFELLMALALRYFVDSKVDYAVLETGLGGLHDATNVTERPDKVCVITDIGLDHTHILGNTLPEIATQKAGIIHKENEVFLYKKQPDVQSVFDKWGANNGARLNILNEDEVRHMLPKGTDISKLPVYQQRNWMLAYRTYHYLKQRDGLPELSAKELNGTMGTVVPGRMDIRTISGSTLIMDGAHNLQKTLAFVGSFKKLYPGKRASVLLSMKDDKDYAEILPLLQEITSNLIITSFNQTQDIPSYSVDVNKLAAAALDSGFKSVTVEPDQDLAYKLLLKMQDKIKIITGSFYLLAQLRHAHKELKQNDTN